MLPDAISVRHAIDMSEPANVDWANSELPDAWPDRMDLRRPSQLLAYVRRLFGARRRVELPAGLPGADRIPGYVCQEFHHLPNGFYSKRGAAGYAGWFDRLMLGSTIQARKRLAKELAGCSAALDAGCGAGALAGALRAVGVPDVWGVDPSPYLLQIAARRQVGVRFVQGIIERTEFADAQFDGVGVCFLLHELPSRVADAALDELRRILTSGGLLAIAEPSPAQLRVRKLPAFVRRNGVLGIYFWLLANWVHEPFVQTWHDRDVAGWLAGHGFTLLYDEPGMPIRFLCARAR